LFLCAMYFRSYFGYLNTIRYMLHNNRANRIAGSVCHVIFWSLHFSFCHYYYHSQIIKDLVLLLLNEFPWCLLFANVPRFRMTISISVNIVIINSCLYKPIERSKSVAAAAVRNSYIVCNGIWRWVKSVLVFLNRGSPK